MSEMLPLHIRELLYDKYGGKIVTTSQRVWVPHTTPADRAAGRHKSIGRNASHVAHAARCSGFNVELVSVQEDGTLLEIDDRVRNRLSQIERDESPIG